MKLIDLLVQELPKRGGWPEGVLSITQDNDSSLCAWDTNDPHYDGFSWKHHTGNSYLHQTVSGVMKMTIYYEGLVTCVNCGPCDYFSVGNSYELKQRNCDGMYFITDDNGIKDFHGAM